MMGIEEDQGSGPNLLLAGCVTVALHSSSSNGDSDAAPGGTGHDRCGTLTAFTLDLRGLIQEGGSQVDKAPSLRPSFREKTLGTARHQVRSSRSSHSTPQQTRASLRREPDPGKPKPGRPGLPLGQVT